MNKIVIGLAVTVVIASAGMGCAGRGKTIHTTETVQYPAAATRDAGVVENGTQPVVVERKTEETENESGSSGVLSTTVHVVGEIVALPFRIVAGLIRVIF